jgi:hypothetical protein
MVASEAKVIIMKFCCADCGRPEEILAESAAPCLYCGGEMIAESDYRDLWLSPFIAIRRMATISETYGKEVARSDGRFKREREAWTTAALALALAKLTGVQWWIEIETVESTPDTRLRRIDQSSGDNVIQTYCVEVVDWETNVDDIMDVIQKKCERAYPFHYLLVVHARHVGKVLDLDRVIEQMKAVHSPFLEVWVVGAIAPDQLRVVRVAPSGPIIDLSVREEMERASKQPAFLRRGNRGTGTDFRHLGPTFLPIP